MKRNARVGDIVHQVIHMEATPEGDPDQWRCMAAMVTAVIDQKEGRVYLRTFPRGGGTWDDHEADYGKDDLEWHFIEECSYSSE